MDWLVPPRGDEDGAGRQGTIPPPGDESWLGTADVDVENGGGVLFRVHAERQVPPFRPGLRREIPPPGEAEVALDRR